MDARQLTIQEINRQMGLSLPESMTEDEIIQLLASKIVAYLDKGPEAFFQLMYRLDIPEQKLNTAIHTTDAAAEIAKLVYQRQLQKMRSRAEHRRNRNDTDPELDW